MVQSVVWIIDTSSIIEVRRSVQNTPRTVIFQRMSALIQEGKLIFPKQVVEELERAADPKSPDAQYEWAKENEGNVTQRAPSLDDLKAVLKEVPAVLDPDKDTGVDEADPYLLAVAVRLRAEGKDARIVTQEHRDTPRKISLSTASGLLGVPSVPLDAFLKFEGIT